MADDDNDRPASRELTAREAVLDPEMRARLEEWFGLAPPEEPPPPPDDYFADQLAARANALAAIDPAMMAWLQRRRAHHGDSRFDPPVVRVRLDPSIVRTDITAYDEPPPKPEMVPSSALEQALRECVPQALLRDLHRPVEEFERSYQVDPANVIERVDGREVVDAAMMARSTPPIIQPTVEGTAAFESAIAMLKQPWLRLLAAQPLPNRRLEDDPLSSPNAEEP